ncbi:MAG: helix-turn-helix domain-containing protein [Proteobacteria bacterium]|nr:helix-turn-helix domain-containing protein [Pseudomonadota bacterium]
MKKGQQKAMAVKELGHRIRVERKAKGWTLKELSSRVGISVMTLQRIETAQVSPSVALLLDIAHCLERPIGHFLDEKSPLLRVFSWKDLNRMSDEIKEVVDLIPLGMVSNDIAVQLETGRRDKTKPPRASEGRAAVHVLEGSAVVVHRGKRVALSQGETVCYDASVKHAVRLPASAMVLKVVKKAG